jgi:hypothetical protein
MLLLGVCFVIPYAPEAFKSSFPTEEQAAHQPTVGRSILSEESFRYPVEQPAVYSYLNRSTVHRVSFFCSFKFQDSGSTVLLGLIHLVLFILVMVKIFVYGEANVSPNSQAMRKFWTYRKQVSLLFSLRAKF